MSDKHRPETPNSDAVENVLYIDNLPVVATFANRFEQNIPSHRYNAALFNASLLAQKIGTNITIEPGVQTYGMPSILYSMISNVQSKTPYQCEGHVVFSDREEPDAQPDANRRAEFDWELSRLRDDISLDPAERPFIVKSTKGQKTIAVGWATRCYAARDNESIETQTNALCDAVVKLCELAFPIVKSKYVLAVLEPKNSFVYPGEAATVIFFDKEWDKTGKHRPFAAHDDEAYSVYSPRQEIFEQPATAASVPKPLALIRTSVDDRTAARILAMEAAHGKLAASVHVRETTTYYEWQGESCDDVSEFEVEFLCDVDRIPAVVGLIEAKHPYECPEILVSNASTPSPAFAEWANATET